MKAERIVYILVDKAGVFCGVFDNEAAAKREKDNRAKDPWFDCFQPHYIEKHKIVK